MGAGTRAQEIRQRRMRKKRRKKEQVKELAQLMSRARTHPDRVKIAREYWTKIRGAARAAG